MPHGTFHEMDASKFVSLIDQESVRLAVEARAKRLGLRPVSIEEIEAKFTIPFPKHSALPHNTFRPVLHK